MQEATQGVHISEVRHNLRCMSILSNFIKNSIQVTKRSRFQAVKKNIQQKINAIIQKKKQGMHLGK